MLNKSLELNVDGNSKALQAGRDAIDNSTNNNVYFLNINTDSDETEITIIDKIFNNVIEQIETNQAAEVDKTFINAKKKIKLNFKDDAEVDLVTIFLQYAYVKLYLIEYRIQLEEPEVQRDLHSHILLRYIKLKRTGISNIQILEHLFDEFTPRNKISDPQYTNLAKAFVLFFFDDCTIFEKTDEEKNKQQFLDFGQ